MKRKVFIVLITALLFISFKTQAHDFEVTNDAGTKIYYKIITPSTVKVTFEGNTRYYANGEYSAAVSIPSAVTYNDINYSVVGIDDEAFWGCSALSSVVMPNTIVSIGDRAFYNCMQLVSVSFSSSLRTIGVEAFNFCRGLESIVLPGSVTNIAAEAFRYSGALMSIRCLGYVPPVIDSTTFLDVPKSIPITVPNGTSEVYQAAPWWSEFTNIESNNQTNLFDTICEGQIYTENGFNDSITGKYSLYLHAANGSDSLVVLNLVVNITPINFTIESGTNYFDLSWHGYGETYVVYRNEDSIATVTDTIYRDNDLSDSINYCYKIKSFTPYCESDFSQEVCKLFTIGLDDIENNNFEAKLYPNPTHDNTTLEIEGLKVDANVIVSDMMGRIVKTYNLYPSKNRLQINVNDFSSKGIYNVTIKTKNSIETKILIVM
jgi:hypothetical protein